MCYKDHHNNNRGISPSTHVFFVLLNQSVPLDALKISYSSLPLDEYSYTTDEAIKIHECAQSENYRFFDSMRKKNEAFFPVLLNMLNGQYPSLQEQFDKKYGLSL